jgi:Meiotically up-regulated gene 113
VKSRDDMIGQSFGSWVVLSFDQAKGKGRNYYYICQCKCGNQVSVNGSCLRKQKSTQCQKCSGKINGRKGIYAKDKTKKDLYMMQCGPYIKIGCSDNVQLRLATIQAANPFPVKLIGLWKDYGHMEKTWHDNLKHLHHSGEWYKAGFCEIP